MSARRTLPAKARRRRLLVTEPELRRLGALGPECDELARLILYAVALLREQDPKKARTL